MKTRIKIIAFFLPLLLLSTYSQAQDGSLDLSFGTGGIVTTNISNTEEEAKAVCVQPDGKTLVLGHYVNGSKKDIVIIRYYVNGTMDNSFGTNGIVKLHITACGNVGTSICLQPDGKILVGGYITSSAGVDFIIARYNSNGSLDTSFGTVGYTTLDLGGNTSDRLYDIQLQPDGKILAAGVGLNSFAIVRCNSNGSLDTSFDFDGKVTTSFANSTTSLANAMALQPDGKILLVGLAYINNSPVVALARYNSNGSLDLSFNSDGMVTTNVGAGPERAYGVDIQTDGKILVVGYSTSSHFFLIRYNSNGNLDTSFDTDGIIITTNIVTARGGQPFKVKQLPSGKILIAGHLMSSNLRQFALIRYNNDGSLDTSFGFGGIATTVIGNGSTAYAMDLQPNGKIVLAGVSFNGINDDFALVRYNSDGSLDLSFSNDGIITTSVREASFDYAYDVCLQPDGKILITGDFNNGPHSNVAVVRYNADGSLDPSFGSGGIATASSGSNNNDWASAIALQPNGKIVVAGYSMLGVGLDRDFHLFQFNSDGSLDDSFGLGGMTSTSIGNNNSDYIKDLKIQPNGKILVAGYSYNGTKSDFTLIRYNSNGDLDPSFSIGGIATTVIGNGSAAYAMDLQPSGKIVLVGSTSNGTDNDFAVVRYNSNGSLDSSFDFDGIVGTPIENSDDIAFAVKTLPNGKTLVGGNTDIGIAFVQYNIDGSLDTTFGTDGIVSIPSSNSFGSLSDIYIQPNGKILCMGYFSINSFEHDFAMARLNSNGSVDSTFGTNGIVINSIGSSTSVAYAVSMQPDGKILAIGTSEGASSAMDFTVVRYNNPTINVNYVESNLLNLSIYPNPFKTTTTIEFGTTVDNAELSIYSIFGQKLKTITNISDSKIHLNREELASGIYIISLTQNKKMIATEQIVIMD
jgi:uncharacterized delta-60 repeat protein